ncbi:hypothetical protein [Paraferrimonas sedimenticola]|uniref:Uncharacterized protein n=1 Tax=Paraferrimonas sedimenticola TaxID=375674 RepID=A0AA37VXK1_9GAMM|nr:hypothetical protein [Paraferrimonas sedimenticola]GLP96609.1 hypothetical protein GCM10007895_19150 [Paraferrimonas sedimenticola]
MKTNIAWILLALVVGFVMFQFKPMLGGATLPLFLLLVGFITYRGYRLMENDDEDSN